MSAPLVGITPIFAVCFWAYDLGKTLVRSVFSVPEGTDLSLLQIGLAGAFSAVPTTVRVCVCSLDICRFAMDRLCSVPEGMVWLLCFR
jgi:hypothetical protein